MESRISSAVEVLRTHRLLTVARGGSWRLILRSFRTRRTPEYTALPENLMLSTTNIKRKRASVLRHRMPTNTPLDVKRDTQTQQGVPVFQLITSRIASRNQKGECQWNRSVCWQREGWGWLCCVVRGAVEKQPWWRQPGNSSKSHQLTQRYKTRKDQQEITTYPFNGSFFFWGDLYVLLAAAPSTSRRGGSAATTTTASRSRLRVVQHLYKLLLVLLYHLQHRARTQACSHCSISAVHLSHSCPESSFSGVVPTFNTEIASTFAGYIAEKVQTCHTTTQHLWCAVWSHTEDPQVQSYNKKNPPRKRDGVLSACTHL